MIKKAIDLLYIAKQNGIDILLVEEQLQLKLPKDKSIDRNLLQELKDNKALLVDFLKNNKRNHKSNNKIKIVERELIERIPLSFSQERLWFIDRLEGSVHYHMPAVMRLKGKLNKKALANALQEIVNRHEVLRTVIRENEGRPYQFIKDKDKWKLNVDDGSMFRDDTEGLQRYIQNLTNAPFDLSEDDMIRGNLICINDDDHVLVITMHHIVSDGWSIPILVKEVIELYGAFEEDRPARLTPLEIQYADFAVWQRNFLQGDTLEKKLSYWKNKLEGVATLQLPTDYKRPAIQSLKGAMVNFTIDIELSNALQMLSRQEGTTLFMTLLAAFKVLMYRYSGQYDISVGTPIAGRQQQELEGLIGFFVNTLVLRSDLSNNPSFTEFLQRVKATTLEAYDHQEVPFEKVVDALVNEREMSRSPLFQVVFTLQNAREVPEYKSGDLKLSGETIVHDSAKFDITLFISESPGGLKCLLEYCTDLFSEQTLRRMIDHFKELLSSIVKNPSQSIGELPILNSAEKNQLLIEFNETAMEYPKDKSIIDIFQEQAANNPQRIALVCGDKHVTYKELNERSNQIAHYLRSKGIKEETLVPVNMERSIELVTVILGILKSGGAYVPIDPDYPEERIGFMTEDTGASIMISNKQNKSKLSALQNIEIIDSDSDRAEINTHSSENLQIKIKPDNLAYVIYTSGSTGKPKGVLIEHGSVVNLIMWHNKEYEVSNLSRSTSMAGVGFDAFGWEVWPYLSAGASVFIVDDEKRLSPFELVKLINDNSITHCFIATATVNEFVNASRNKISSLRFLLTGGDKLSSLNLEGTDYKIVNNYGPTENTVVTCYYELSEKDKDTVPPIGKPVSNTKIQILSPEGQLVPVGVAGEIHIGGDGLARGYLNQPELTGEKFIEVRFNEDSIMRMYKSGDLGRWLNNGNIEFIGRLDDQVKIRGYRIELGEIETVLNKLEPVNSSCVLLRSAPEKKIVGYYVLNPQTVKAKEHELYHLQVDSWKELYDTQYSETDEETVDEEFNIIGWNDSFTGTAIPAEQMKEWVDDISEVILSQHPENVLEIGCGTGLIYYRLTEKINKYIGTDFSGSSINQITKRINKKLRNYCLTELQVCGAHEVTLKKDEKVDTIILNSIVQYFPGEEYMNEVIGKSISVLKGKGCIIIGDVRDYRLLELFKARLQLQKLHHSISVKELKWLTDQDVLKEEELCFSPEYFYRLQKIYPDITNIEIKWKQASYFNELSLYRFTVVIHVGIEKEITKPEWKDWSTVDKQKVIEQLSKDCRMLALKNVPNPRLWKEKLLSNALKNKKVNTTGELLNFMENEDKESLDIKEILDFAKLMGYNCRLFIDEDPLNINLVIEKNSSDSFIRLPFDQNYNDNQLYTNIPLFNDVSLLLKKEIRNMLLKSLPDYMIPADLIAINKMPLTNNGKVDRNFLSSREDLLVTAKLNYQAPGTDTEQMLAKIWQKLLGIDRISVNDNFFELGGHSLLAMRVISSIRKELEFEIAIKDLFLYPTIAELAEHLEDKSKGLILPPVVAEPRPEFIPLSFSQERLWFIDRLEGSLQYHMPAVLRLKGKLNREALAYALQNIVNRHEVLRSVIKEKDGKGYQLIKEKDGWNLQIVDGRQYKDNVEALQNFIQQLINVPFDLSEDYMMRCHLINVNEHDNILVVTMHHIASDGWSLSVIVKELVELYQAYEENREPDLPVLPVQYADYAMWQRKYVQGDVLEKKLAYWKEKLEDAEPLELPTDYTRPAVQSIKGAALGFKIEKELSDQLQELSQQQGITLFMTLLAVFNVLLHRYSRQQNICVGTPIAGRQQEEVEKLIGFFVNTLALNNKLIPQDSFTELLHQVRATTMEAYEHQEVPFEKVVESIVKQRDMSRSPLFQVMFALQNTPEVPKLHLGEVNLLRESYAYKTSKFDLSFYITETPLGLQGSVEYCTDLYNEQTMSRMIGHFKELLRSVVKDPQQKIGLLPMLTRPEEEQLLVEFNKTDFDYPRDKSIKDLFEEQVTKTPEAVAVMFEQKKLTYRELNEYSNRLAHFLKSKGVKQDTLIPICIERGINMIIGILGVLKSGGAFVPIDPEYPEERIIYMLEDIESPLVISSKESREKLSTLENTEIIEMDSGFLSDDKFSADNLQITVKPTNLAYVIYTSGSTGKPKGVMIEQKSVVNLLKSVEDKVGFTNSSAFLSVTTFSFDICYLELFLPLVTGARLIIVPRDVSIDGYKLADSISFYKVTHMQATPATWMLLLDCHWENKEGIKILIGGEAVSEYIKDELTKKGDVFNLYGPTETTIWSTVKKLETNEKVLIGSPLANTKIYILNELQQLCPLKVAGEICIAGDGLARGYFKRPDLTEEKFVVNPFGKDSEAKIYKTGDMGYWMPDGSIDCLGRRDDQVKIRGYRIELGEIESVLQQNELVNQAIVLIRQNDEINRSLIGYYLPKWQAVKEKERELYNMQVANWKEVYETEYSKSETTADEEFDINIWNDSFTGKPIGEAQMREWVNDIAEEILSQQPENVLEIGCGTGLIYYRIAEKIKKYIGTDFSKSSINQITKRISKKLRNYCSTQLKVCAAHEITLNEEEKVDTIILNSIVQYFPGEDYLSDVIAKSISLLKNNGRIIIGDVRDNRLLELFKGRIRMQKLQHSVTIKEFKWATEQDVLKEEELCLSPEYFYRLQTIYPQITHIDIKWKQGSYSNELSLYRYTVVIYVGVEKEIIKPDWQDWKDNVDKQSNIEQLRNDSKMLAIKNAPNPRLWKERLLSNALNNKTLSTVGDLLYSIESEDKESLQINELLNYAMSKGYRYRLFLNEDPFKVNVLIEKNPADCFIQLPDNLKNFESNYYYSNVPLFSDISLLLKKEIRIMLRHNLPEYMIPADLIALNQFPLTNNGKVDRKFLSQRENKIVSNKLDYKAPETEIEKKLAIIWQELLGVERIGVHDNFFELGGHSLLALRLFSSIEKLTGRKLAISTLFNSPTIKELAAIIKDEGWKPHWKSLIPIKPDGTRLPLFYIPPAAATALSFQGLLKYISQDQPVYVLESIGLDGKEPPHDDLRKMAAFYVNEIQSLQSEGPYLIAGRCFGGRVAYEVAQQLINAGQKVGLLAIFDTWPPFDAPPPVFIREKRNIKKIASLLALHLRTGKLWTVTKNYTSNKLLKATWKIRKKLEYLLSDSKKRLYDEIMLIHFKAQDRYVATKYPGKITLIECGTFHAENREKWKNLAEGGLESYLIPGTDHRTIMNEPHVRLFAEKLNYVLEKANEEIESHTKTNGKINKHFHILQKTLSYVFVDSILNFL